MLKFFLVESRVFFRKMGVFKGGIELFFNEFKNVR